MEIIALYCSWEYMCTVLYLLDYWGLRFGSSLWVSFIRLTCGRVTWGFLLIFTFFVKVFYI